MRMLNHTKLLDCYTARVAVLSTSALGDECCRTLPRRLRSSSTSDGARWPRCCEAPRPLPPGYLALTEAGYPIASALSLLFWPPSGGALVRPSVTERHTDIAKPGRETPVAIGSRSHALFAVCRGRTDGLTKSATAGRPKRRESAEAIG